MRLVGAGVVAHVGLSVGWAVVLDAVLPARRRLAWGALAGLGIAGLDLGLAHAVAHRRLAAIRALPVGPQVADHVAYGIAIASGSR